jgi:hypothetical protein
MDDTILRNLTPGKLAPENFTPENSLPKTSSRRLTPENSLPKTHSGKLTPEYLPARKLAATKTHSREFHFQTLLVKE